MTEIHSPRVAVLRGRRTSWVGVGGVIGFAGIFALVRARRSQAFDVAWMLKLQRRNHPIAAAGHARPRPGPAFLPRAG
ncbi:MAG: hypothetical protein WKF78_11475 [Candidatus Limnocylindrales bacterium]